METSEVHSGGRPSLPVSRETPRSPDKCEGQDRADWLMMTSSESILLTRTPVSRAPAPCQPQSVRVRGAQALWRQGGWCLQRSHVGRWAVMGTRSQGEMKREVRGSLELEKGRAGYCPSQCHQPSSPPLTAWKGLHMAPSLCQSWPVLWGRWPRQRAASGTSCSHPQQSWQGP